MKQFDERTSARNSRRRLPQRRSAIAVELEHAGHRFRMQIGRFPDGVQGEVFLDAAKQNSALDALAADAAILISLLLQHGATPAEIGHTLRRAPDGTAASLIGAVVDRLVEEGAPAAANHLLADSGSSPILGVDPGITGGLAFLFPTGALEVGDIPVVAGEVDVDTLVRQVRAFSPALAVIERANAMPKQGVSSTFKYGVAYGALRTVVALCNIPYRLVTPSKWKNHFGLDSDKEKSRALAIQFWPGCGFFSRKKDHGRAEAALIARYGAETIATNFAAPSGKGEATAIRRHNEQRKELNHDYRTNDYEPRHRRCARNERVALARGSQRRSRR